MGTFGPQAMKWLKTAHVCCACLWGGGALSLVLLHWAVSPTSGDELFARDLCMKLIDDFVVSPGAVGCLLTGLLFAVYTPWGFFRHRWITLKWTLNVGFIAFGAIFFVPWLNTMSRISDLKRLAALEDPVYLRSAFMNRAAAVGMALSLFLLVWASIFKPWDRRRKH